MPERNNLLLNVARNLSTRDVLPLALSLAYPFYNCAMYQGVLQRGKVLDDLVAASDTERVDISSVLFPPDSPCHVDSEGFLACKPGSFGIQDSVIGEEFHPFDKPSCNAEVETNFVGMDESGHREYQVTIFSEDIINPEDIKVENLVVENERHQFDIIFNGGRCRKEVVLD